MQVADYCLWALQRFYERREDRFLNLLTPKIGLIHDVDDTAPIRCGGILHEKQSVNARVERKRIAGRYRGIRRHPHGVEPSFVHQLQES